MNIYTLEGWPDFEKIYNQRCPFVFIIGGRGTGKTYGALYDVLIRRRKKFIYLRRTETELKTCMAETLNPFREINHNCGTDFRIKKQGEMYVCVDGDEYVGTALALSTISNTKGMSAYDVDFIIFDEFIKDANKRRTIKDEAKAFFDVYETVNRNRELAGNPPVMVYALANSTEAANPIFMALKLVLVNEKQKQRGIFPAIYKNIERGILLIDFGATNPISAKKRDTALYRLTAGTTYSAMALDNAFAYDNPSTIVSRSLKEYTPVVFVGELAIYRHKSRNVYYCTTHRSGGAPEYGAGATDLIRFQRCFYWLWDAYISNRIEFENYSCEALLTNYYE